MVLSALPQPRLTMRRVATLRRSTRASLLFLPQCVDQHCYIHGQQKPVQDEYRCQIRHQSITDKADIAHYGENAQFDHTRGAEGHGYQYGSEISDQIRIGVRHLKRSG
jgi:hypothetical protein